jgi:hypothetical protein
MLATLCASAVCAMLWNGRPLLNSLLLGISCGVIYWTLFTVGINYATGKKFDYLGTEAQSDQQLVKFLGNKAGRTLIFAGLILLVLYNTLLKLHIL